jgi:hypothetical protein
MRVQGYDFLIMFRHTIPELLNIEQFYHENSIKSKLKVCYYSNLGYALDMIGKPSTRKVS